MSDKIHMSGQSGVHYSVGIAKYLTQRFDSIMLEHFDIHTFAYVVFDFDIFQHERIISNAAIFYPVRMIRFVP